VRVDCQFYQLYNTHASSEAGALLIRSCLQQCVPGGPDGEGRTASGLRSQRAVSPSSQCVS